MNVTVGIGHKIVIFVIVFVLSYPIWGLAFFILDGLFQEIYKMIFGESAFRETQHWCGGYHGIPRYWDRQGVEVKRTPPAVQVFDWLLGIAVFVFVYIVSSFIWNSWGSMKLFQMK